MCSKDTTYTRNGCDGWKSTSLEECKSKCSRNDSPSGCQNGNTCRYVIWESNNKFKPGWCHLASDSCNIIDVLDHPDLELWVTARGHSGKNNNYLAHVK